MPGTSALPTALSPEGGGWGRARGRDERRFNVMMTRARRGLIVLGDSHTLRRNQMWGEWLQWVQERNLDIYLPPEALQASLMDKEEFDLMHPEMEEEEEGEDLVTAPDDSGEAAAAEEEAEEAEEEETVVAVPAPAAAVGMKKRQR